MECTWTEFIGIMLAGFFVGNVLDRLFWTVLNRFFRWLDEMDS